MRPSTSSSTDHGIHNELADFCTDYIGHSLFDFVPVCDRLNRTPLRKASVVSVKVVRGQRRGLRISLNIKVDEGREIIEQALSKSFVPDAPELSVLIFRTFVEDSSGGRWKHKIEFVQDPTQKATSGEPGILMGGSFHKLRLFHIMDLVRIIADEFKKVPHPSDRAAFPNDEDFTLVVTGIIHRFSHDWEHAPQSAAPMFPHAHPDILKALNISNWFFERWCKEAPPQLFSLEDFSSWNDGTVRTLLSYPRDGGPLFCFEEHHDSFRRKFGREQVLEYSLKNFCDHILHGVDPLESYATIVGFTRYKEPDGLKHEFVILHARLPAGVWTSELEFWIRLDRAAIRDAQKDVGGSLKSSTFPADDKAYVAQTREPLLRRSRRAKKQVSLYPRSRGFNVRELAKLLEIFSGEAPEYVFATNNCYFFASIIQEAATKYSDCAPAELTWAKRIPTDTFGRIMMRYDAACSMSSLLSEEEAAGCNASSKGMSTGTVTTMDVDTPLFGPGSGSNVSTRSRPSSVAHVLRQATGIFQRRRSTNRGRVLAKGDDLTDEPESMVIDGESPIAASNDAETKVFSNRRAKRPTLPGFVRNMLPHRRTTNKGSIAAEVQGVAQPSGSNENA